MSSETTGSPFPTSGSMGTSGSGQSTVSATGMPPSYEDEQGRVRRVAQKAHEAVDKLEQTIGTGSEKVMSWQQEYGEMCREQVRTNPLAAVGIAFGVGIIFSKLFMR